MFERYSEQARRVVFFARYATSEYGGNRIEPQHLLLGVLKESPDLVPEGREVRREVEQGIPRGQKLSTSVEIPFSELSERVLRLAERQANRLGHRRIGTEHILHALLNEESPVSVLLHSRGIHLPEPKEDRLPLGGVEQLMAGDAVYLLWHTDAQGDEKLIGVYMTEPNASAAVERLKDKQGFADAGGSFEIAEYRVNEDHWTEGFTRTPD